MTPVFLSRALILAAGLAAAGSAAAQTSGVLVGRLGLTQIRPDVTSGDLTTPSFVGTKADIEPDTQPTAGLTWFWTDRIAFDLPLAAGFKHDIVGDGAIAGVGKIGEVKALPITLLAQFHFGSPTAALRPYLGIGPTYAKFYKARSTAALTALTGGTPDDPTTLKMDSKLTVTLQAGLGWRFDRRWGLDVSVTKTPLKTRATLSTGQTLDAKVDPWSFSAGVTYRF
ncbi:MAG: outer membrane protein OmpW [Rubrivivax sp.]